MENWLKSGTLTALIHYRSARRAKIRFCSDSTRNCLPRDWRTISVQKCLCGRLNEIILQKSPLLDPLLKNALQNDRLISIANPLTSTMITLYRYWSQVVNYLSTIVLWNLQNQKTGSLINVSQEKPSPSRRRFLQTLRPRLTGKIAEKLYPFTWSSFQGGASKWRT